MVYSVHMLAQYHAVFARAAIHVTAEETTSITTAPASAKLLAGPGHSVLDLSPRLGLHEPPATSFQNLYMERRVSSATLMPPTDLSFCAWSQKMNFSARKKLCL